MSRSAIVASGLMLSFPFVLLAMCYGALPSELPVLGIPLTTTRQPSQPNRCSSFFAFHAFGTRAYLRLCCSLLLQSNRISKHWT